MATRSRFSTVSSVRDYKRGSLADQRRPKPVSASRASGDTVNPLQPYFLVYVHEDNEVRYSFAHPKQVLEVCRVLCAGKTAPNKELCALFDKDTNDGKRMGKYNSLLDRAAASIAIGLNRRIAAGLVRGGRGFVIPNQEELVERPDDLDLVTWIVIKKACAMSRAGDRVTVS